MKTAFHIIYANVVKFLDDNLPKYLTYHDTNHTLYVLEKAEYIAQKEHVTPNDLRLLKIAALYHDIGFVNSHNDHEEESCKIAQNDLKNYGFSQKDINIICGMIMATKIPQQPKNKLEDILADADLEYLATPNFSKISARLYQELTYYNPKLTRDEWNRIQVDFITNHQYHTPFCKHYKSFRKQNNLNRLKSQL